MYFQDSGIPIMNHIPEDYITLKGKKRNDVNIEVKSIFEICKKLGHYKAPDGMCTTIFEKWLNKANKLARDVVKYGWFRSDTQMLYQSVW